MMFGSQWVAALEKVLDADEAGLQIVQLVDLHLQLSVFLTDAPHAG